MTILKSSKHPGLLMFVAYGAILSFAACKGDRGSPGPRGEPGADGRLGHAGADGSAGNDGEDGQDGEDGSRGKDGKDGKDGAHGKDGENGEDGRDGSSAGGGGAGGADGGGEEGGSPGLPLSTEEAQAVRALRSLQRPSGLVAVEATHLGCPGGPTQEASSVFVNAVSALALIESGELQRAEQILDRFREADPPNAGNCAGGYQQHRDVSTGAPIPGGPNDFWLGDISWLLTAFRQYRSVTGEARYDAPIAQIFDWVACLWAATPRPGIYAGYTSEGAYIQGNGGPVKHAEGTIDLIGALNALDSHFDALGDEERSVSVLEIQSDLKSWIDQNVWVQNGECFDRGPDNEAVLPLDHVTWGLWALIDEDPRYACLLSREAEGDLARVVKPWVVDDFGPTPSTWSVQHENDNGSPTPSVISRSLVPYSALDISYDIGTGGFNWALVNRDAALDVTPGFNYRVGPVAADATGAGFEVKLYGSVSWRDAGGVVQTSCASVVHESALSASEMEPLVMGWEDFRWFQPPSDPIPVRLDHISRIEFAVSSLAAPRAGSLSLSGPLTYSDIGVGGAELEGFADFSNRGDVIWAEGTGHMALSYCLVGDDVSHQFYLGQLQKMFVASGGLPSFVSPGSLHSAPNAVANAWYVLASRCANPFDFD
jgi:hypothetical protein